MFQYPNCLLGAGLSPKRISSLICICFLSWATIRLQKSSILGEHRKPSPEIMGLKMLCDMNLL